MYDHALHRGRKYLCRYCLQAFSEKKNCYVKIALKLMVNK